MVWNILQICFSDSYIYLVRWGCISMDLAKLFKQVANLFVRYFSMTFMFNGMKISVGAVLLFAAIAVVLIWFVRSLSE